MGEIALFMIECMSALQARHAAKQLPEAVLPGSAREKTPLHRPQEPAAGPVPCPTTALWREYALGLGLQWHAGLRTDTQMYKKGGGMRGGVLHPWQPSCGCSSLVSLGGAIKGPPACCCHMQISCLCLPCIQGVGANRRACQLLSNIFSSNTKLGRHLGNDSNAGK